MHAMAELSYIGPDDGRQFSVPLSEYGFPPEVWQVPVFVGIITYQISDDVFDQDNPAHNVMLFRCATRRDDGVFVYRLVV